MAFKHLSGVRKNPHSPFLFINSSCCSKALSAGELCTWYSHTEEGAVVDHREEAQDTFGPMDLLRLQAVLWVADHRHIRPINHDLQLYLETNMDTFGK